MNKRGQVTIFVILGIIVLAIVGFVIQQRGYIGGGELDDESNEHWISSQIEPFEDGIETCVEGGLLRAIRQVLLQGGKSSPLADRSLEWGGTLIARAYDGTIPRTYLPTLTGLGIELQSYIRGDEEIAECINGVFDSFEGIGMAVSPIGDFNIGAPMISDNELKQTINYPLEVQRGDYTAIVDDLLAVVRVPVGRALRGANAIVSCYNGDYVNYPDYNLFCNVGGVTFDWWTYTFVSGETNYGVNQLTSDINFLDSCTRFHKIFLPVESEEDITFNVLFNLIC